ncbi:hypothetical protein ACLB2K_065186 [Fragaria x ananassa]
MAPKKEKAPPPSSKPVNSGGGKQKKKKWSKGKQKEKVNNMVLFDQATYDKLLSEALKFKLITPSISSYKLRINGSLARCAIKDLMPFSLCLLLRHHRLLPHRWQPFSLCLLLRHHRFLPHRWQAFSLCLSFFFATVASCLSNSAVFMEGLIFLLYQTPRPSRQRTHRAFWPADSARLLASELRVSSRFGLVKCVFTNDYRGDVG